MNNHEYHQQYIQAMKKLHGTDGGQTREQAETEARRTLRARFGDRLIDARTHNHDAGYPDNGGKQ